MNSKVKAILAALKGPEVKKSRTGYAHTYAYYAKLYDKDLSTIKRWAREGKPLDDEPLMREMLSPRGRKPEAGDAAGETFTTEPDATSPVLLDTKFFEGEGVLAAIGRLKKAEQERAGAYFRAIQTRQATAIVQNRFKEWVGVIESLRKLEESAPAIRKLNDLSVDVADMEAGIGTVFAAFRTSVRNFPGRAAPKLIGLRDRDEIFGILEKEAEVLLRSLTDIAVGAVKAAELELAQVEVPPPPEPIEPEPPEPARDQTAKKPRSTKRKAKRRK